MTPEPDPQPPGTLSDQVDQALEAFWRGDHDRLRALLATGDTPVAVTAFLDSLGEAESAAVAGEARLPSITGFTIQRTIDHGGMGVVYEAQQREPRRTVALKVMRAGYLTDAHRLRLFQREVQSLARLQHPAVATIYQAGRTDDGHPYFAMELIRGERLIDYARLNWLLLEGRVLLILGRPDDAVAVFDQAVQRYPKDPISHRARAKAAPPHRRSRC